MARLPLQNPEHAVGGNKQIFDLLQKKLGMVPNMTRAMANSPAVLQSYAQFSGAMATASLSARIREQIALLTAEENGCVYCLSAHTAVGRMIGLDEHQIDDARRGRAEDKRTHAALQFASRLIEHRGGVHADDVRAVREAGFSDAEIAEIVAAVALNLFTNFFNRAIDVDVDFPRVETRRGNEVAAAR